MQNINIEFPAHGGKLKQLVVANLRKQPTFEDRYENAKPFVLSQRQLCDLELLLNGGFSPLNGFMDETTYESVIHDLRLPNGDVWPIPIVLDVTDISEYHVGDELILQDNYNEPYAFFKISSIYKPNKIIEAKKVYASVDTNQFGVDQLMHVTGKYYLGGTVVGFNEIKHYDFKVYRQTPYTLRTLFKKLNWTTVAGFQTRNPLHKAHYELIRLAAELYTAKILLHPSVGQTKEDDIDYITRTKCYIRLQQQYMSSFSILSLLPLAMRMAGPREALLHAIIRRNYGCTHFIIGRDHASPGNDQKGNPYFDAYEAHELVRSFQKDIDIIPIYMKEIVYVKEAKKYIPLNEVEKNQSIIRITGSEVRHKLLNNEAIPEWYSFPDVIDELRNNFNQKKIKGLTIFFTGLPSSGKSTLARSLQAKLMEVQNRGISVLDGDVIRKTLSKGLGFSREDRFINITRIGFVAKEITKHKGIAICAAVAPNQEARKANREMVGRYGNYVEVYLSTPLDVCMHRDVKGLYRKAKSKKLIKMTGIDDIYEPPMNPELTIDTTKKSIDECVNEIISYLQNNHLLM